MKQLLIANDKNRLRWVVLGLSQDGAGIDLFENHSENSLKEDLSNVTSFNSSLFSLVNTFNKDLFPCAGLNANHHLVASNGWTALDFARETGHSAVRQVGAED